MTRYKSQMACLGGHGPSPIPTFSVSKEGLVGTLGFEFSRDISRRLLSETHHLPICQPATVHSLAQGHHNSSVTRQSSQMTIKAQRPPSGLPSVFPEEIASVHRTKCSGSASRPVACRKAATTTTEKLSVPL